MKENERTNQIINDVEKHLVGKKIVGIRYLTEAEMKASYWYSRCPVLILDDGTIVLPLSDEEGNEGGVFEIISNKTDHPIGGGEFINVIPRI